MFSVIYFDNSATTKPYDEVLDTYIKVSRDFYGNASSLHNFGGKAEQLIIKARQQIADLLGVKTDEIIFTSGGTEGNNLAIKGTAQQYAGRGKHIITTKVEHPSVIEPCKQLEEMGFKITYLPVQANGTISIEQLQQAITDDTILVSIIHVNNEVGAVQPIKEIGQVLKQYPKIIFHVDHVQGAGKIPLDLYKCHIDLCTLSAHKFRGLKGTGILFKRQAVRLASQMTGGQQENKLRSGTENTAGIVAMARALRMMQEQYRQNSDHMNMVHNYIVEQLKEMPGVKLHSPELGAAHIINFSAIGHKGEVIVHAFEEEGIILSTTSACSSKENKPSHTLLAMGIDTDIAKSAVRVSLSYDNTMEEAEKFISAFRKILQRLNKVLERKS